MHTDTIDLTIAQRIELWQLNSTAIRVPVRPEGVASTWQADARHWYVVLFDGRYRPADARARAFGTFYSQGSAHTKTPTTADILDALRLDASSYTDAAGDFGAFYSESGYEDATKARADWKACKRTARALKALLGAERYDLLLYHTEGL